MLSRAKRIDNGKLIKGYHVRELTVVGKVRGFKDYICNLYKEKREINPKTLSISLGLDDVDGVEIFGSFPVDGTMSIGGDRVREDISAMHSDHKIYREGNIEWVDFGFMMHEIKGTGYAEIRSGGDYEIIGSQMDSPENSK